MVGILDFPAIFFVMAYIYKQIEDYCKKSKKTIPSLEIRKQIGQKVIKEWFKEENILNKYCALHRVKISEMGNEYEVISYPKKFKPVIDAVIIQCIGGNFKKHRKKIKLKPKPVYQAKPSLNRF